MYIIQLYKSIDEDHAQFEISDENFKKIAPQLNDATQRFIFLGNALIAISNISSIVEYKNNLPIDMPYNPLQLNEPVTMVKPETLRKAKDKIQEMKNRVEDNLFVNPATMNPNK